MRILILAGLLVMGQAIGADVFQWSQGFTAGCEDAIEREDGSTLCNGVNCSPSEIAAVRYYVDPVDGNMDTPALTFLMTGGCTATLVDTKGLNADGTVYYRYAVTQDTDGRWSSNPSSPGLPFTLTKAKPKHPNVTQ